MQSSAPRRPITPFLPQNPSRWRSRGVGVILPPGLFQPSGPARKPHSSLRRELWSRPPGETRPAAGSEQHRKTSTCSALRTAVPGTPRRASEVAQPGSPSSPACSPLCRGQLCPPGPPPTPHVTPLPLPPSSMALSIFSALEPARSSPLPSLLPVASAWKALPPAHSSPVIWVILTPPGASGTPPLAPLIECNAHTTSDSSASMACDLSLPNPQHTCGALLYACLPWSVPVHQSIPRAQHRVWHIAENQYLFTELKRAA